MPVQFENYTHSFILNGKPVFAPNDLGRRIGEDIKSKVEEAYSFEPFYYHLAAGGHVAALHAHREMEFFCKADIENFFYTISRNRVVRALKEIGIARAKHYGKWSCVRSPFENPRYAIPYGFVQSPILASLTLATSTVGHFLRQVSDRITVAVYVDDITMSSNDPNELRECYSKLLKLMVEANLPPKLAKCLAPDSQIDVFKCHLENKKTEVLADRKADFYAAARSPNSIDAFERYCNNVSKGSK